MKNISRIISIIVWIVSMLMVQVENKEVWIAGLILLILSSLALLILFGIDDGFDGIDLD